MQRNVDEFEARRLNKAKARQQHWQERQERSKLNRAEIDELKYKWADLRKELDAKEQSEDRANTVEEEEGQVFTHFNQLPISQRTQMGLERGNYKKLTPIQSDTLHLALAGYDVLGAAKTGSGKTLCFVIPVLEKLFVEHWDPEMGLGALILSPTRELALQIFKVMQVVGYKHVHSAALLTGGRDVNEERKRLHAISIIVGTPGRVLHHLQDDPTLVLDNLQIFCMDEADRLLDMGFREAVTNILRYLPPQRQTLLFSATQTADVQMLAQMSLQNPRYVTSQAITKVPTPATLCQNFMVLELHRKVDALLLFLKRHPNDKVVVFMSTCNQVKFMYLAFSQILKKMRIPSMCLTSKMKQFRREEVFLTFCRCKSAVLFCTDVASRGLDFPLVHWVIQYDCPDSAQTYIHRAGRTARAGARGVCLLFLTPRETPMLSYLAHKNVPLREIAIKPTMMQDSHQIFVALVVQGLKYEAQKAFIAYLRSVYFASNKHVFEVASIDVAAFAKSLGLLVVPDMSELHQLQRGAKNLPWDVVNYIAQRKRDEDAGGAASAPSKGTLTKKEKHLQASDMFRMLETKQRFAPKSGVLGDVADDVKGNGNDSDSDDDFLVKKPRPAAVAAAGSDPSTTTTDAEAKGAEKMGEAAQRSTGGVAQSEESRLHLTAEERLAGLSKSKRRRFIETPDLRVRDLGLSQHIIFRDSDDDDDDDNGQDEGGGGGREEEDPVTKARAAAAAAALAKLQGTSSASLTEGRSRVKAGRRHGEDSDSAHSESESGEDDEEEEEDEADFAAKLRNRVQASRETDNDRAKRLRRLRRLKKEGKISKRSTLTESGVSSVTGGPRPEKDDDDDDSEMSNEYVDSSSASDGEDNNSGDDSLGRLIKAARGELYDEDGHARDGSGYAKSESGGASLQSSEASSEDAPVERGGSSASRAKGNAKAKGKRSRYHGIDSSDDNTEEDDEDEQAEYVQRDARGRNGKGKPASATASRGGRRNEEAGASQVQTKKRRVA